MSDVKTRISRTKEYLAIMLDEIVEGVRADERERCRKEELVFSYSQGVDDERKRCVHAVEDAEKEFVAKGVKWWEGANPVGYDGEPFSDFDTAAISSCWSPKSPFQMVIEAIKAPSNTPEGE